jgi:uncharacterized membrane protein
MLYPAYPQPYGSGYFVAVKCRNRQPPNHPDYIRNRAWDPYPFILLNLFLSMLAAIQAPVIMMSQNRQDVKDRLRSELDFEVNRRAEAEIQSLSQRLSLLVNKVEDVEDLLRTDRLPAGSNPEASET